MMQIEVYSLGPLEANCYLVWADDPQHVAVIDPGDDIPRLQAALRGRRVDGVLITHAHFDHILGLPALPPAQIYVHSLDAAAMTDDTLSCAVWGSAHPAIAATELIAEGDVIPLAGLRFTVLHTPGHTVGSVCYRCEDALFTGDTLFAQGCGRTDLPGGSESQMQASLRRLLSLDDNLTVYPGHGASARLNAR